MSLSAETVAESTQSDTAASGDFYADKGKRLFDLAVVALLLPFLVPVIALLWIVVRSDGGAGFYGHKRIGQNGKVFQCWKLRSMCADAEDRLAAHLADCPVSAAQWHRDFKLENDPRITRFGHFIRKTSLDELPQVWNVLMGEMSLVGPRPVTVTELGRYGSRAVVYRRMRPGITGAWQVSGRNGVSYARRVALDVQYARRMSVWTDLGILCATLGAVLNRTGK